MKKLALQIMSVFILMAISCKDVKEKQIDEPKNTNDDVVLEEEDVVDNFENPSDSSFIAALDAYQKGNYTRASELIENRVIELREEERPNEKLNGLLLDTGIEKIRSLED